MPAPSRPGSLMLLGLLVVMGAAWGLEFSMLKLATQAGFPGTGVLLVALALIACVYLGLIVVRRRCFRLTRAMLLFFLVIALLGYVLPLLVALWAAPHVPAGLMTLIASFTPVVAVVTALAFRTERVSPRRMIAVALGTAAAVIVVLPELELPGFGILVWLLLVFVVPATYGIESVYVSVAWPGNLDPLQVAAGQSLVALAVLLPGYLLWGEPIRYDPAWPAGQWAILAVAGCVLVEVLLYFVIIQASGGVLVNLNMYISLFAGFAWGWAIFGECHGMEVWLAVALLAAGLAFTIPRRDRG
ncbi:MAG: DMT family transporter [Proteobacteria bacterium]|nr:DMT family transporter [Pseudomonadota bacterium]